MVSALYRLSSTQIHGRKQQVGGIVHAIHVRVAVRRCVCVCCCLVFLFIHAIVWRLAFSMARTVRKACSNGGAFAVEKFHLSAYWTECFGTNTSAIFLRREMWIWCFCANCRFRLCVVYLTLILVRNQITNHLMNNWVTQFGVWRLQTSSVFPIFPSRMWRGHFVNEVKKWTWIQWLPVNVWNFMIGTILSTRI